MNRKTLISLMTAAIVIIAGIGFALAKLYSDSPEETMPAGHFIENHELLKAVPSDAAIVFCFKDFKKACEYMGDTVSVFGFLASDKFSFLAGESFQSLRKAPAIMSVHYSNDMPPLLVIEYDDEPTMAAADSIQVQIDTTPDLRKLLRLAEGEGLFTSMENGLLMLSSSETIIKSSKRHLAEGHSIMESNGFPELASRVRKDDAVFINNGYSNNLVRAFLAKKHYDKDDFFREVAKWTALSVEHHSASNVSLHGDLLYTGDQSAYLTILETIASTSAVAEAIPAHADYALSLPIGSIGKYIKAYRAYLDSQVRLDKYDRELGSQQASTGTSAETWAKSLDIKEVAIIGINAADKVAQLLLIKPGSRQKDCEPSQFTQASFTSTLFGSTFRGESEDTYAIVNGWLVIGTADGVNEYSKSLDQDGILKDCLSDNGLAERLPGKNCGFWGYWSLGEDPTLLDGAFSKSMALGFRNVLKGAPYVPATFALTFSSGKMVFDVNVDRTTITKSTVPTVDRDTTVTVPEGPFEVTNSGTGKTNRFYQNSHRSLCLQDENGKDIWGVPFKERICGYVQDIDYFNNGKIQFLFAAGSRLYLIDRLGRFVSGFPADLGKAIVLGPAVHDFTGAKGYTAMVLFKDNTIGYIDLHGKTVPGWQGIAPEETIKSLPELIEVQGRKFWIVRTSRQAALYPFDGGAPAVKGEGTKMIRPESKFTAEEKGTISASCYDGKVRSFKVIK
jgi:hypothetical protein